MKTRNHFPAAIFLPSNTEHGCVGLDQSQAPFEVADIDRPDKGVYYQSCGRPAGLPDRPLANR